jgi:hypothetical protein
MPKAIEPDDLEVCEHLEFQRLNWIAERIGWLVIVFVTVAAIAGLFGRGLAGTAIAATGDNRLAVEYHRFWRMQSPMTLRIRVDAIAAEERRAHVWISRAYLRTVRVSQMMPRPERVEAGSDRVVFIFALTSDAAAAEITFAVEPESPGFLRGRAGLEGGPEVEFTQFIYP